MVKAFIIYFLSITIVLEKLALAKSAEKVPLIVACILQLPKCGYYKKRPAIRYAGARRFLRLSAAHSQPCQKKTDTGQNNSFQHSGGKRNILHIQNKMFGHLKNQAFIH
ncbi:hypothetical protein ACFSMW_18725 [Virgibacillus halophilus]